MSHASHTEAPPSWFHNAVLSGMQFLLSLRLEGAPAAEIVGLTATAWVQALWAVPWRWVEADQARLQTAFETVAGRVERWPAPRAVLDALPRRPEPPSLPPPKPAPQSPEIRRRVAELLGRRATAAAVDEAAAHAAPQKGAPA